LRQRGHYARSPKHIARSHATAGDDNALIVDPFDGAARQHLDAEIGQGRRRTNAKSLLSVLLGIRVLARTRPQRDVLEGAANGVLALLGKHKSF
jgi:hypothetical protein